MDRIDPQHHAARCGGASQSRELSRPRHAGIGECRHVAGGGHQLHQDLQPLAVELSCQNADASEVSTGMGKGRDQSARDHVVGDTKYRNRPGRGLCRHHPEGTRSQQHVGSQSHQLCDRCRSLLRGSLKAPVDYQILSDDEAGFAEVGNYNARLWRPARQSGQYPEAVGPVAFLRPHGTMPDDRHGAGGQYGAACRQALH